MTSALLLLTAGGVVLSWRPCQSGRGAAPRSAVALLLGATAAVWAGSFGLVVNVIAGDVGGTLPACGTLWRQLLAGQLAWWETMLIAAWALLVPGRGIAALTIAGMRSRRLASNLRAAGVTPATAPTAPDRTFIVPGLSTTAVTLGVLRPMILVDQHFWDQATPLQRRIVLAHEQGHRHGRHVLLDGTARLLLAALTPLPPARAAYECVRRHLEALADDAAVRSLDARTVGVELGRIALADAPRAGLGASGAALWRVERLLNPAVPVRRIGSVLLLTAAFAVGLVVVLEQTAHALAPVANANFCPV